MMVVGRTAGQASVGRDGGEGAVGAKTSKELFGAGSTASQNLKTLIIPA